MDNWLEVYSGGAYKDLVKDAEESPAMQKFINMFTWDLIIYSCASIAHSLLIMTVGFVAAGYIFMQMVSYETAAGSGNDVAYLIGWKAMLLGVLIGSVDYMAGNANKGTIESMMLAMGFQVHEYADEKFLTITKDVTGQDTVT